MDNEVFHIMSQAFSLSKKAEKVGEAYKSASTLYKEGKLTEEFHVTFGWIAYRYLKEKYIALGSKGARTILATYFKLKMERPSLIHSMFLYLAINIKKRYPDFRFTSFMDMWGYDNFRNEDWVPYIKEQQSFPSTVQKVINLCMAENKDNKAKELSESFVGLLKKAVAKYPQDYNSKRYLAIALARKGEKAEAVEVYRELLIYDNRYYLWNELGNLIGDRQLKKSAFCMALLKQKKEEYLGSIHLSLAELLIGYGDYGQALTDLEKYKRTYDTNKWTISVQYHSLIGRIPSGTMPAKRNAEWLKKQAKPIQGFVMKKLPSQTMFMQDVFTSKKGNKMCRMLAYDKSTIICDYGKCPDLHDSQGDFFRVYYTKREHWTQVVYIEKATEEDVRQDWKDNISRLEGKIRITAKADGKMFGFVKDCYVGKHLLKGIKNGMSVQVVAFKENNKMYALKVII